mgnify:CR=1 FL=1
MSRVRVESFGLSLDGYGAGPGQSLEQPLGAGGAALHEWLLPTRTAQRMVFGREGGSTGVDEEFAARGFDNIGAWILGRNMFAPSRGPWTDLSWKGWWGDNPPYHVPVFVLTHHPRQPLEMEGGTCFHFVTGGIHEALARAREAAAGRDVRIGGGACTIRQYLQAGLVDELHLAIAPVLLGRGEVLFAGLDLVAAGYECSHFQGSDRAMHVLLRRRPATRQHAGRRIESGEGRMEERRPPATTGEGAGLSIRRARRGDEAALALVGQATFLETFAGMLDGAAIIGHCASAHAAAAYAAWLDTEGHAAWLVQAEPGGAPVGYLLLAPAALPGTDPARDLEIKRIYLLGRYQGGGLGRRLLEQAIAQARASGAARLVLGVYAGNHAAQAFYRRQGFRHLGDRQFQVGDKSYADHVMALELGVPAADAAPAPEVSA